MSIAKHRKSVDNTNFLKKNKIFNLMEGTAITKLIQLKKLKTLLSINDEKILEIKGFKKSSTFHLIGENDKYKQIQKQLQNTIINLSIQMIKDFKFDPELTEICSKYSKKTMTSKKYLTPKNYNINNRPKYKFRPSVKKFKAFSKNESN